MSTPRPLEPVNISYYMAKGLCRCDEVKNIDKGRLFCIIHVGQKKSQKSLQEGGKNIRVRETDRTTGAEVRERNM